MSKATVAQGSSKSIHFYCSSGGNAGLACVTAAIALQRPATIVVPFSTSGLMIKKLQDLGANVVQKGQHWHEADSWLRLELLAKDENGVYVPPFDHEDIWEGNSSIVAELEMQMSCLGGYDAVVCSVGGGGLFCGIMEGLHKHGRMIGGGGKSVRVLAMETRGAHSLNLSLRAGQLSRLPAISSIATSLGATQVAQKAFEYGQTLDVTSHILSDAEAAMACVNFANDERILIESACGASIATVYNGTLRQILYPSLTNDEFSKLRIVIVVCGGSNVTLDILDGYREKYSQDETVLRTFTSKKRGYSLEC
jgi:L-serine/L-threonine ammonia-lyase